MTIFLRDGAQTLADIEVALEDVRAVVPILGYSLLLLRQDGLEAKAQCMADFQRVQELRAWYWESFRPHPNDKPTKAQTVAAIKGILGPIVVRYGLNLVTD